MKKLLFAFPIVALLAAGCNSTQQSSIQAPVSQDTQSQQIQQQQVTPTPTEQPATNIQNTDWKVYTNSTAGFSVNYPAGWVFSSNSNGVGFTDWTGDQWKFGIYATSTNQTLQQASDQNRLDLQYDVGLYATLQEKSLIQDGEPAVQFFYQAPGKAFYGDTQTFVIHDGKLYTISEGYGADPNESAMLQSFKFTQ